MSPEPVGPSIIPLSVHYLTADPKVRQKLTDSLDASNEILRPHGVGLIMWSEDVLFLLPSEVNTRQDRQLLRSMAKRDGTLHVFFVDEVSLRDGDSLSGLYVTEGGYPRGFVIVTKGARLTTMTHEVGHALGLDHVDDEGNVMSNDRKAASAYFTDEQGRKMRGLAHRFIARGW